eukprot:gene3674-3935_t
MAADGESQGDQPAFVSHLKALVRALDRTKLRQHQIRGIGMEDNKIYNLTHKK